MSLPFVRQGYHPKDDDYYVILDVDFNASKETITSAYRNLARKYHPDKNNTDDRSRKEAQMIFEKIKTAYEVLGDPHKRQVYDTLGPEGLKLDWKLVKKQMTAQELRDEYLRIQQMEMQNKMAIVAKPRASFTIGIDASNIFSSPKRDLDDLASDDDDEYGLTGFLPIIEITSMSASVGVKNHLATNHSLTLSGNVSAKNGTGDASFCTNYKYDYSRANQFDLVYRVGGDPIVTAGLTHKLNDKTSLAGRGFLIIDPYGLVPGFKLTLAHKIRNYLIGNVSYKESNNSTVSTSLIYINNKLMVEITTTYKLSKLDQVASVDIGYKFNNDDSRVSVSIAASSNQGLAIEYGCETRVLQINAIGAALSFSLSHGVTLKICYSRANQDFTIPIYLSDEVHSAPLFYGTMVPLISYYLLDRCYLRHYKQLR